MHGCCGFTAGLVGCNVCLRQTPVSQDLLVSIGSAFLTERARSERKILRMCDSQSNLGIKQLRKKMEEAERLADLKAMQVDVLLQALEKLNDERQNLLGSRESLRSSADRRLARRQIRFPLLPNEIVLHIFSMLYYNDLPKDSTKISTTKLVIADPRTPKSWVTAICRFVPRLVSLPTSLPQIREIDDRIHRVQKVYKRDLLGPCPFIQAVGEQRSKHILVSGVLDLLDLHQLQELNLAVESKSLQTFIIGFDEGHQSPKNVVDVLELCHHWLSTTTYLVMTICEKAESSGWNEQLESLLAGQRPWRIHDNFHDSSSQLIEAHVHPLFLYSLQPILSRVVKLTLVFATPLDEFKLCMLLDRLKSLPLMLVELDFDNSSRQQLRSEHHFQTWQMLQGRQPILLPSLETITFRGFLYSFRLRVMESLDCPELDTVRLLPSRHVDDQKDTTACETLMDLHEISNKFPELRHLSVIQVSVHAIGSD